MGFWENKKVLVTGGAGFVGHHVVGALKDSSCQDIFVCRSKDYDLTKEEEVKKLFNDYRFDVVLHLAGLVGGIWANKSRPGDFFYRNLMMGTLVMEYSRKSGVKKVVALAAGCGYPKYLDVPYSETDFWTGLPDENSIGYSMAKKMLIIQSWTYREQFGFDSSILLPANLYGPNDNFDLNNSHVIPGLVRKFVEAAINQDGVVEVWGTGKASREFLYVKDAAKAILKVAENYHESGPLNLGTGVETSIKELVELIKIISGFKGSISWDSSKPDGQPRRYYDMTLFKENLQYIPDTPLETGLKETIGWYKEHRTEIAKYER